MKRPGLRVLARRGYVAAPEEPAKRAEASEDAAPDLRPLLDSPIPVSGLTLESAVATFRGANGKASALVTLEVAPEFELKESDGAHKGRVDVAVLAISSEGNVFGGDQRGIELKLEPKTLAHVSRHGFRTLSRLELPPGRYQVRIAARQQGTDRGGSVVHDIVVPDYPAAPLAMSDLVLASRGASQAVTTKPDPELRDRLALPPTASRRFDPRDTVTVFAELYDNRAGAREGVVLVTTLTDASGKVAYRAEEPVEAFSFEPARKSWTHRIEIPLADVQPGAHVLRVEARPRGGASPAVSREVPLEVGQKRDTTT